MPLTANIPQLRGLCSRKGRPFLRIRVPIDLAALLPDVYGPRCLRLTRFRLPILRRLTRAAIMRHITRAQIAEMLAKQARDRERLAQWAEEHPA